MRVKDLIPIGVLFSHSGPYAGLGREGYHGAMAAIAEINRRDLPFEFTAMTADPAGNADRYAALSEQLINRSGARHIIGCTTSWSRKEVIPVVEKRDALLWYPCVYEGFEASDKVIYIAACANQHLVPMIDYILPRFGKQAVLLGSNYIWGWETNRIAREMLDAANGQILAERYMAIGDTDIGHLINEIRQKRPNFILNNLIGASSHAFLRAYHALGLEDIAFSPDNCPVLSCNFYEGELAQLPQEAAGNYTVSCYFNSLPTPENAAFMSAVSDEGYDGVVSAFFAQSYAAVQMIAQAIAQGGSDAITSVLHHATSSAVKTPLGEITIDARTNHIALHAHIAKACADGSFEIIHQSKTAIEPDPFLTSPRLQSAQCNETVTKQNYGHKSKSLRLVG